jgi:ABC-type lipoprotein export system ATPase subunit
MPSEAEILLETRNLSKLFRKGTTRQVTAVDGVSLIIARGTFTVLTGPSGSGKTTLLALLGALERPTAGQVIFADRDLSICSDVELARLRRRMGFVFQDFALIPGLSVEDNITYPLIPRGFSRGARRTLARSLLARFDLEAKLFALPADLSGGEQQRVALARALAGDPELLLLDEPTSNLDPEASRFALSILRELHAQGRTIILATHEAQAIAFSSQVHELDKGRLKVDV